MVSPGAQNVASNSTTATNTATRTRLQANEGLQLEKDARAWKEAVIQIGKVHKSAIAVYIDGSGDVLGHQIGVTVAATTI